MNICVYGASSALLKNIYYEKTEELGRAMGKRGHGLVFGGGATGMMGAAARGVAAENGYILGIAPRFFDQPGVLYEKCTEFIFTENMRERKKLLEEKSDATIVAPGGIGTYEEFFEIFTLKSLKRIDRPIVLYNIDGYYDKMKALLEYTAEEKFMDFSVLDLVVFLDEPTAVLTPQEVEELFHILRELKAQNKSIVIITHKLKETLAIADSISVLRDGKMITSHVSIKGATADSLAQMMVGREVTLGVSRKARSVGGTALRVRDITLKKKDRYILNHISLELKKGEILGIAGIEGNGQTELIECLTGICHPDRLDMEKDGQSIKGGPDEFIRKGIGHIPEDRMTRGLVLDLSILDNMILGYQGRFQKNGILDRKKMKQFADSLLQEFRIKAPNPLVKASSLSGGNQQKIVIARVFSEDPDIIIVAQPTRGVDIGAMEYIHERLLDLRDEGKAVLLISADLDEVKSLSDRLAVIYDGELVAEGRPEEFDDMELGLLMTGAKGERRASI